MRGDARDRRLIRLAARQHGVFTTAQAYAHGWTRGTIRWRVRHGRIRKAGPGVWVLSGAPTTWQQRVLVACLVTGGVASHRTAAALHGVLDSRPSAIHVTVARSSGATSRPGVVVHRPVRAGRPPSVKIEGIPTTPIVRTLIDVAATETVGTAEAALDDALVRRLVHLPDLTRLLSEGALAGWGVSRLRRLAEDRSLGVPKSVLERMFLDIVRDAGLPDPLRNYRVGRYELDAAYPDQRVFVELEGGRWHDGVARRRRDARRQNWVVAQGWTPLRYGYDDLSMAPRRVAAEVAALLGVDARSVRP